MISSETCRPLWRNRSLQMERAGEEYMPVQKPASMRMELRKAQVEPFPLVPTTATQR